VFPHLSGLLIDRVERTAAGLLIWGRAAASVVECWACGTRTSRVHSRYQRSVGDVAVAGRPVVIRLTVRRFFCLSAGCAKVTFAEQLAGLTVRHGRRSPLRTQALEAIGLALGGRAGERLAGALSLPAGRATLLRLVRNLPEPGITAPAVLGIDDFALRRGKAYGTILVDMETRRPVDLVAGRTAEVVADWLTAHPGVQVICRDRASAYAEGASAGAPDAVQVADRWHLWHNLIEAAEKCVIQHKACLREPAEAAGESAADPPATLEMDTESALITRIRDRHAAVRELISSGCAVIPAARQLGLSRNTVRRYSRAARVDELLESAARPSNLDAFKPYLHERWNAGQTRPSRLFEEIGALGYSGSNANVRDYVRRLRAWAEASPEVTPPPPVRVVVTWIARHPDRLDPADQERLAAILGRCPELDALSTRIREFAAMMGHRLGDRLPRWLASARATSLPGLQSFAAGIEKDQAAVTAGLTLDWSSGPVEGHVNRIKMLKRQMYGRASTDLLRKRVLMSF
jgi:transposase